MPFNMMPFNMKSPEEVTEYYAKADEIQHTGTFTNIFGADSSSYGDQGWSEALSADGSNATAAGLHPIEYQAALRGMSSRDLLEQKYEHEHGAGSTKYGVDVDCGNYSYWMQQQLNEIAEFHGMNAGEYFNQGSQTGWGGPGTAEYEAQMAGLAKVGLEYGCVTQPYNQIAGGNYDQPQAKSASDVYPTSQSQSYPTGTDGADKAQDASEKTSSDGTAHTSEQIIAGGKTAVAEVIEDVLKVLDEAGIIDIDQVKDNIGSARDKSDAQQATSSTEKGADYSDYSIG